MIYNYEFIRNTNFIFQSPEALDPGYVFLVDAGLKIYVWYGLKCKNVLKSKARLMSEKINKIERKNKGQIQIFSQGSINVINEYGAVFS